MVKQAGALLTTQNYKNQGGRKLSARMNRLIDQALEIQKQIEAGTYPTPMTLLVASIYAPCPM
jgi:hypothetical protein